MNILLFIAPPAFGKTRWLLNAFGEIDKKWVVVTPLRALGEEMLKNFSEIHPCFHLWQNKNEHWMDWKKIKNGVLVVTPEKILEIPEAEWMSLSEEVIVIWDEWHLIQFWGESFRPALLEAKWLLMGLGFPVVGLTATQDLKLIDDELCTVIDYGNFKIKNEPQKINFYLNKKHFQDQLIFEVESDKGTLLHFVSYRQQVSRWIEIWKENNVVALGCVGGETVAFTEELKNLIPQIIVSTTALSHGVNLPSFSSVFIEGGASTLSLWIQMVARGGRRGEAFNVHTILSKESYKYLTLSSFLCMIFRFAWFKVREFIFGDRGHYFTSRSF